MGFSFKGLATKFVSAAKDLKSEILKAAQKAPAVVNEVEKDAPEIDALINLAFPGAGAVEQTALTTFETIMDAVEAAGPAAAQNGLSVSLDKTAVASVQSAAAAVKAAAAKL